MQVRLPMNGCGRMLFQNMQQGHLCVEAACHLLDDGEHRLREARAVERDKKTEMTLILMV